MPPDDVSPSAGFHSYADGTPRPDADDTPLPATVHWREIPAHMDLEAAPKARAKGWRTAAVAATASGLTALVTFGWTALQRRDAEPAPAPAPPMAAAEAPSGLQVVVTDPPPAPPPPKSARLEVLAPSRPPPARTDTALPPIVVASAPSRPVAAAQPAPRAGMRPAPPPRNAFNRCADAPTPARRMVCGDMRLAAADQRMKAAYAMALAAGVPDRWLARDQDEWLEVREDAARVSRGAVLDVYRQRTQELKILAREH